MAGIKVFKNSGCNHVRITDVNGNQLRIFTIAGMKEALRNGEDYLLNQIKSDLRRAGLLGGTPAQMKTYIEQQDYDLGDG